MADEGQQVEGANGAASTSERSLRKRRIIAAIVSLVGPGIGHLALGRVALGALLIATPPLLLLLLCIALGAGMAHPCLSG